MNAPGIYQWLAAQREWHVCALETLPQRSPVANYLLQRLQESGMSIDSTLTPNFIIDLPPTWPEYMSSLDSSFRPLLTRYPKRLQSRFTVKFSRCEDVDDLKTQLQTLFDLHQMRWTGRGETGAFARNARRDFYQSNGRGISATRLAGILAAGIERRNRWSPVLLSLQRYGLTFAGRLSS